MGKNFLDNSFDFNKLRIQREAHPNKVEIDVLKDRIRKGIINPLPVFIERAIKPYGGTLVNKEILDEQMKEEDRYVCYNVSFPDSGEQFGIALRTSDRFTVALSAHNGKPVLTEAVIDLVTELIEYGYDKKNLLNTTCSACVLDSYENNGNKLCICGPNIFNDKYADTHNSYTNVADVEFALNVTKDDLINQAYIDKFKKFITMLIPYSTEHPIHNIYLHRHTIFESEDVLYDLLQYCRSNKIGVLTHRQEVQLYKNWTRPSISIYSDFKKNNKYLIYWVYNPLDGLCYPKEIDYISIKAKRK